MAEALWNALGAGRWHAVSAGSNPSGYVHPLAIQAMGELERDEAFQDIVCLDIAANQSKHANQFADENFDLVVTVCDHAQENCPAFPGAKAHLHWPFDDPADATGTDEEKLAVFRRVRDEVRQRIAEYFVEPSLESRL
jgi:arsenate reductase